MNMEKRLIVVVDDHPHVLRFIEVDLKLRGFKVITTTSGEEALELIRLKKPDMMLLDLIMPGIDGLEVLRQLRAFSLLPVIAFSATSEKRESAIRMGANDFLTKPFHPEELDRKIEALLKPQTSHSQLPSENLAAG